MDTCIYETENFRVVIPENPHIPREDGGHIMIVSKNNIFSRVDMTRDEAHEFIDLSIIVGRAFKIAMNKLGINVEWINYQENGNWSFKYQKFPHFHMHIYGRVENSVTQKFSDALYFPDPETGFYDGFTCLTSEDGNEIAKQILNVKEEFENK